METIGKGGKGGSTRKKRKLAPVFTVNATAGNAGNTTATGGNLTSDTNKAIARSIATHAKEETVREVYKEDQLSLGKRESEKDYWSKLPSTSNEAYDLMDSDTEDEEDKKKPSAADQPTVPEVDSDSEEEEDKKPSAAPSAADLDTLINDVCTALLVGTDVRSLDLAKVKAIRSFHSFMTDPQLQQIKEAFQKRLRNDHGDGMFGHVPNRAIDEFCSDIDSATIGLIVALLQLLCPVTRDGVFISYAAGDTRPAGFNPDTCATTRGLEKLLNRLQGKSNHKTMTGEVRWKCEDCCGHCKKCTEGEGEALSKVYNLLALFYYLTGGELNFFNVGGVSTKIKEYLASNLIPEYFGMIEARGYHLSLLAYLSSCFGTFKNGATILTLYVTDRCEKMGIREAVEDMIKDKRLPMVVDLDDIEEAERKWKSGLSQRQKERYEARSAEWKAAFHTARGKDSWEARVKKDGIEAAHDYMAMIGSLGGVASFEAKVEREGYAAIRDQMSEMGKIGGSKKYSNMVARVGIDGAHAVMKDMASEGGNAFRDQEVQKYGKEEANRRLKEKLNCNPGLREMQRRSDLTTMNKCLKTGKEFHFVEAKCLRKTGKNVLCGQVSIGIVVSASASGSQKTCSHCEQSGAKSMPFPKGKHDLVSAWVCVAVHKEGSPIYCSQIEALKKKPKKVSPKTIKASLKLEPAKSSPKKKRKSSMKMKMTAQPRVNNTSLKHYGVDQLMDVDREMYKPRDGFNHGNSKEKEVEVIVLDHGKEDSNSKNKKEVEVIVLDE